MFLPRASKDIQRSAVASSLFFHNPPLAADDVELELGPLSSTDLQRLTYTDTSGWRKGEATYVTV